MKYIYLLAVVLLGLCSCQQKKIETKSQYSDEFMSKLEFKTVNKEDLKTRVREPVLINITIFSVKIARPSLLCKKGFGFCNFRWFPKGGDVKITPEMIDSELYKNSFAILTDENGRQYVELALAEGSRNVDVTRLQPLVVEETLEGYATIDSREEVMKVPAGVYPFDKSIGEFGGYRVYLKQERLCVH